ncbi:MAG: cation transporter, partial [Lachnospiraceae bacterium]|nr:cation transporter [Lachnospiraceae bacterium]
DKLTRKLERKIYKETGVVLAGVGLYSYNTGSNEAADIQKDVRERVMVHDWAVQLHGFYVDTEAKEMTFDVVMSFDIGPREGLQIIYNEVKEAYPEYSIQIAPDVDVSD